MCLSVCQHGTWSRVITWMVDCHGMVNGADRLLKNSTPPGGLEPPTFRLTAERASQLRHGGFTQSTAQIYTKLDTLPLWSSG